MYSKLSYFTRLYCFQSMCTFKGPMKWYFVTLHLLGFV